MTGLPPAPPPPPDRPPSDRLAYWLGLPFRWAYQMAHNGHGVVRVLDITRFRPLPAGLVGPDHPWATGIDPETGRYVWHRNVVFRSPRADEALDLPLDDYVVTKTGQFLAKRVAESVAPDVPGRRMPHGINYIHGASHYNSGTLIFSDFKDAYGYFTDPRFRAEVYRFVRDQRREVLILFRRKRYDPKEFAYFVCCLRTLFPWFCNANGPRGRVLWGNAAPFPAANLITGCWVTDVYALKRPGGATAVVRPPVPPKTYFQGEYGGGRGDARWPEKVLARATYWRVRLRGAKGGMYFVDRRKVYADQIEQRKKLGLPDQPIARF